MQKKISPTHNKKTKVPEKTYLHTYLLTWKPLVSLYFISKRTRTSNTKSKLQEIKIVTALLSPGQWAVQPLCGWILYSWILA